MAAAEASWLCAWRTALSTGSGPMRPSWPLVVMAEPTSLRLQRIHAQETAMPWRPGQACLCRIRSLCSSTPQVSCCVLNMLFHMQHIAAAIAVAVACIRSQVLAFPVCVLYPSSISHVQFTTSNCTALVVLTVSPHHTIPATCCAGM